MSVNNTLQNLTIRDSSLVLRCQTLISEGPNAFKLQTIVQPGTITTPVVCGANPSANVLITTNSSVAGGGTATSFIFQNSLITTTSVVRAFVTDRVGGVNGTNGLPFAQAHTVTTGQCIIDICNCGTTAFAGYFKVLLEISNSF